MTTERVLVEAAWEALATLETIEILDLARNDRQRKLIRECCDRLRDALDLLGEVGDD